MLKRLWQDEAGAVVSAEIMLVATILVIGMIVGLKTVRDAVLTELADVGQAISNVDQSYSYSAVDGHAAFSAGSVFLDVNDFCDMIDDEDALVTDDGRCVNVAATFTAVDPSGAGGEQSDQP